MFPPVLLAAVTLIGAIRVLTKGAVPTGVPGAFIDVTLTSAKEKSNRSLSQLSEHTRPIIRQNEHGVTPLLQKRCPNKADWETTRKQQKQKAEQRPGLL